jgi:hypothetical protein
VGASEVLQQALRDDSCVHEAVIGVELPMDRVAVLLRFAMQMLVSAPPRDSLHVEHPEVIRVGPDRADRLLERDLDLEAQPVDANDLEGI